MMKEEIDLVSLPKKSFWKLSLPIIAFCLFDAIYGIVDMIWVSQISTEAFFAMGMSIPFVTFIFSMGDSIGQGTNSIMSRFIGSGDYESAYNALIHGMIVCNVVWFFICLCFMLANGVLFYDESGDSYVLIFDYLVPIIVFAYLFIFNNLFSETMQAEGNSKTPTALMIGSNILNLILDPIFIFNFNLGIRGAAYATIFSAALVFVPILYLYRSGKTKVPLSLEYFKFRPYILVEIFKVALPNFVDNGLWLLLASFTNSILVMDMNSIGPIIYSVSTKLKNLLIVPIRGYGRALMSVTGHLFGARKFDELNDMYRYVLKLSFITMIVLMIAFVFTREYVFEMFSITGMREEIFWVAAGGTVIMIATPFSMISAKMLDGFGKSMYTLLFTVLKVFGEIIFMIVFYSILGDGRAIFIPMIIWEIITATLYCLFLRYLFRNFERTYEGKSTVRTFTDGDDGEGFADRYYRMVKRWSVGFLVAMVVAVVLISYATVTQHGNLTLITGIAAIIAAGIATYFIKRLTRFTFHIIEIIIISFVILLLLEGTDYLTTILFIVIGVLLLYIISTVHRLKDIK